MRFISIRLSEPDIQHGHVDDGLLKPILTNQHIPVYRGGKSTEIHNSSTSIKYFKSTFKSKKVKE